MPERLGDAPIEAKHHKTMNLLARFLDEQFNGDGPRKVGFVMMVFDFGIGPSRCNYISNAERADVVTLLKEQLARFEGQPDIEGRA